MSMLTGYAFLSFYTACRQIYLLTYRRELKFNHDRICYTIIVFTFLNAVFASAEIAVISMNEAKLRHLVDDGNKRAKSFLSLTVTAGPVSCHHSGCHNSVRISQQCVCI